MSRARRSAVATVRAAIDPELLRTLRSRLDQRFHEQHRMAMSEREAKAVARGESSDAVRMDERWYDLWRDPRPALREAIGPFTLVTYPVQVRHVRQVRQQVPWHQDIGYIRLLGKRAHRQMITCFVPLEDDPAACTTLQFALQPDDELEHRPLGDFGAGVTVPENAETVWFRLALGDALVFGDRALHRTFVPPGGTIERRSLEFRLIAPEDRMAGRDYFDVLAGRLIQT